MLVAWFGDTHGYLHYMYELAHRWEDENKRKIDCIFQVGDFGIWLTPEGVDPPSRRHAEKNGQRITGDFPDFYEGKAEIPILTYFIRGNHEDQLFLMDFEKKQMDEQLGVYWSEPVEICPDLLYVPDGHIIEIGDSQVAAWGGCYGKKSWPMDYWSDTRAALSKKDGQLFPRRLNHMTRDIFEKLIRQSFDILVTHDAPTGIGVGNRPLDPNTSIDPEEITEYDAAGTGVPYIRELIEERQPRYQFNGHWHEYLPGQIRGTTTLVLDKVQPDGRERHCLEVIEL